MQYYETPQMKVYLDVILKYRLPILVFYTFLVVCMAFMYTPRFLTSDALFWLQESKQLKHTQAKQLQTHHLSKLVVTVENFDEKTHQALQTLHDTLVATQGVEKVYSLFGAALIEPPQSTEESEMLTVVTSADVDTVMLRKLVKEQHNQYGNVVDDDFNTFYFFISSQGGVDLDRLDIPGSYEYISNDAEVDWKVIIGYMLGVLLICMVLFRLLFRSYVPFFSGMAVILFSTVLTFAFIVMMTGKETIHLSMIFITMSIVLVEFLYFYYRWHVSQYKHNTTHALMKMLTRSTPPALWTTLITVLGLVSLVLIDSPIIKLLSLSVMFSSILGYLLNITFLPALLSYFSIKHAHVPYVKLGYMLTNREIHYNKQFLYVFLGLSYLLLIVAAFKVYGTSNTFFKLHVKNEQIELKIPYEKIDLGLVRSIDAFSKALQNRFEDEIEDVVSLASVVYSLNESNTQTQILDEEGLEQALFYMDLYGMSENYFDGSATSVLINISEINKIELIEWLQNYKGIELYFVDNATLIGSAKTNQTVLLTTSLFAALLIIGLITGWIFRSKAMAFVGFTVNMVPLVWFGMIISVLSIPLSLEMLIAMTIILGLASDASIHFAYKYFRFRYFGRSRKHALEKMYFYSGIPVIIGSVILMTVFMVLYVSGVHSLELIGMYSAVLVLFSLLSDLFVLPVLLLFIDRFSQTEQKSEGTICSV